jgi:hypothetical protein
MLRDLEVVNKSLSIFNKSFLTLGKPLRLEHTFVYIRDTILLAPQGKRSLNELGKLYEKERDYNKREVSFQELSKMSELLKRDKPFFEEYYVLCKYKSKTSTSKGEI